MGNQCSCYHKEDEIEIKTRENLLKLRKVSVDTDIQKEFELQNTEDAKQISPSKIKYEESEKQKHNEPKNLEKLKTVDSSTCNFIENNTTYSYLVKGSNSVVVA